MKKYIIYFLFPFLFNSLYAVEEKKEIKKHKFSAEETFSLTENTISNLVKGRYNYATKTLEQLAESSFDYIKTDEEIKRKLFRIHYKLGVKKNGYYGFFDTDYQDDRINYRILYITTGLGRRIKYIKIDLGWGYKVIDKSTIVNVLGSSLEASKTFGKWDLGGNLSVKKPLKSPKKLAIYLELSSKYKLSDHFNAVVSYNWIREKPKEEEDSWKKYALRFGIGVSI